MTDKELFHAIARGEPFDRMLLWEQGYWGGAVQRWYAEGMRHVHGLEGDPQHGDTVRSSATPIAAGDRLCVDVAQQAGLDLPSLRVPVELFLCPAFDIEIYEETEAETVQRDEMGIVKRMPKTKDSIPHFQRWPIATMADFERLAAERLSPRSPSRYPADWDARVAALNDYDGIVAGGHPCGFFGATRYLMGEMALLMGFLEQPELVRAIIDHLAELWASIYDRVLSEVRVDCIHIWEDMAFKNGPLISPSLFDEFLVPAYRKVTDVARSHGVDVIIVDTDGDCTQLIELFVKGGVTGMYPFEVQAGMDVRHVREAFPELLLLGGIDKKELAGTHDQIDAELRRRLPGMVAQGRYIPMGDHQIPPDVSWDNYCYYRQRLAALCAQELPR